MAGLKFGGYEGLNFPSVSNQGYGFTPNTDLLSFGSNLGSGDDFNYSLPTSITASVPKIPTQFKWSDQSTWSPWLQENGWLDRKNPDGTTTQGMGGLGLTALQGLANGYMAMKQYGLMKDNLNFQKDSFYKNYEANKSLTNASLADRQNRRNAEAGNIYALTGARPNTQDTASYMAQYGVK